MNFSPSFASTDLNINKNTPNAIDTNTHTHSSKHMKIVQIDDSIVPAMFVCTV